MGGASSRLMPVETSAEFPGARLFMRMPGVVHASQTLQFPIIVVDHFSWERAKCRSQTLAFDLEGSLPLDNFP
jgi:hypothetical protein